MHMTEMCAMRLCGNTKRIFLFFHKIALHTFPSYASSSHVFEKNLFVFPHNRIAHISVICFEFTCFQKESFCFTTDSHYGHFRHMLRVHMILKRIFLCFHIITLHTFPSYASSSHELENTLSVSLQTHMTDISVICFFFI